MQARPHACGGGVRLAPWLLEFLPPPRAAPLTPPCSPSLPVSDSGVRQWSDSGSTQVQQVRQPGLRKNREQPSGHPTRATDSTSFSTALSLTERYFSALRTDGTTPQYIRDQESHHAVLLASGMAWGGSSTTLFRSLSALSQVSCNTSHAWCMRKAASVHTVRARLLGSGSSGRLRQGRARANMHQRHTHSQRGPARAPHC